MSYPRESVEFQSVAVTVDGLPVTTGVTFCIVPNGARPTGFTAPTTLSGKIGVMLTGLAPGIYEVWASIASAPETPVIDCGTVSIT